MALVKASRASRLQFRSCWNRCCSNSVKDERCWVHMTDGDSGNWKYAANQFIKNVVSNLEMCLCDDVSSCSLHEVSTKNLNPDFSNIAQGTSSQELQREWVFIWRLDGDLSFCSQMHLGDCCCCQSRLRQLAGLSLLSTVFWATNVAISLWIMRVSWCWCPLKVPTSLMCVLVHQQNKKNMDELLSDAYTGSPIARF